jgi:transposase
MDTSPLFVDVRSPADRALITSYCPPLSQITNQEPPGVRSPPGVTIAGQVALNATLREREKEEKQTKKQKKKPNPKPEEVQAPPPMEKKPRIYTAFDEAKRRKLTQLWNDPAWQTATATQFAVQISGSLQRTRYYLHQLKRGNRIDGPAKKRGRPSTIRSLFVNEKIRSMFAEAPTLTLRTAEAELKDDADGRLHMSRESVRRVLGEPSAESSTLPLFSWKRTHAVAPAAEEERVKEDRIRFIQELQEHRTQGHAWVFVDETSWNVECVRRYGWAPVGEKATVDRPPAFGSLTAIASISDSGVGHTEIIRGPVCGDVFSSYIQRLLASLRGRGTQCIVLDNATIHHASAPQTIASARHCIVFNAPYSPALNPIEQVFGIWKARVEKEIVHWRGFAAFLEELRTKFLEISVDEVRRTIRGVEQHVWPKVLEKESI